MTTMPAFLARRNAGTSALESAGAITIASTPLATISSTSAVRGFRRAMTVYAASKAAVTSLSEGIRVDLLGTPIKVSCVHPGFIRSEINEKVKNTPFMVDTETGTRTIVNAIEKEKANAFVPAWPWALMKWVMRVMPLSSMAKMS